MLIVIMNLFVEVHKHLHSNAFLLFLAATCFNFFNHFMSQKTCSENDYSVLKKIRNVIKLACFNSVGTTCYFVIE
jgi:predicted ABC-type exoprotein transport system permease subunit